MTKEQVLAKLRNRARGIKPGISGFNNGLKAGIEEAVILAEAELDGGPVPADQLTRELWSRIRNEANKPTLRILAAELDELSRLATDRAAEPDD